jgi:LysM repeat protein
MKTCRLCLFAVLCCLSLLLAACAGKAKTAESELSLETGFGDTGYDDVAASDDIAIEGGLIEETFSVDDASDIQYDPNAVALPGADVSAGTSLATRPARARAGAGVYYTRPRYPVSTTVGYPERGGTTYQSPLTGNKYTIRKGDTLWGISRRYGVSVDALTQANNISRSSTLKVGQTIAIPKGSAAGGTTYASPVTGAKYTVTPGSGGTYTVQPGDTYYGIAKKYGISYQVLMEYNGATSSKLSVGQVLQIP